VGRDGCNGEGIREKTRDASMPTLLDYLQISQIHTESPGFPYRSPNVLDNTHENA